MAHEEQGMTDVQFNYRLQTMMSGETRRIIVALNTETGEHIVQRKQSSDSEVCALGIMLLKESGISRVGKFKLFKMIWKSLKILK